MRKAERDRLIEYARKYETADFLIGDPSWFMHQVTGSENQETMAFLASCLSYGSRKQFMPKIEMLLDASEGETYEWVLGGGYSSMFSADDKHCFYRLYSNEKMFHFLEAYRQLLTEHTTLGNYVRQYAHDGFSAVAAICQYFSNKGVNVIIPKDTTSACKRVCMFLRWMVRSQSPVDIGLWADFIDRRTLIIPLDTHVVSQSQHLGLLTNSTASMTTARKLTETLAEVFPDDPLKGDFALFGYGINHSTSSPNEQ